MLECDTVAQRGPTLQGEFARTLTMTDMSTGWTECGSIRNNTSKWILETVEELREEFPFPMTGFDSEYADIRIMPTLLRKPLSAGAGGQ